MRSHVAVGVYDTAYAPYALGDALTFGMNLNVLAAEHDCDGVDLYVAIDPHRPGARFQPFVTTHTYASILDDLFPVFFCSDRLRSLKIVRSRPLLHLFLLRDWMRRRPMWPSLANQLNQRIDFISHKRINAHWHRHGSLPWLRAPRGYEHVAQRFRAAHCANKFVVATHIRQSAMSASPANTYRDSPYPEWLAFFARAGVLFPDTVFLVLGGYSEWPRSLLRLPNVIVPRRLGLRTGHELALVAGADLFMGTSSGFSTMAIFSSVPYVVTKIEHLFAPYAEIPVGARHYPFGRIEQILHWEEENQDLLVEWLREMREILKVGVRS